jgi:hypothetical protein
MAVILTAAVHGKERARTLLCRLFKGRVAQMFASGRGLLAWPLTHSRALVLQSWVELTLGRY